MRNVLRIVTPPTERAVSLDEARRHLRVEDTDDDALIIAYLEAAEQSLSRQMGRAFKPTTYALDVFHACRMIDLPMIPVTSVTAVSVPGSDGILAPVDISTYSVFVTGEGRGSVWYSSGFPAPISTGAITASVEFIAGSAGKVDAPVRAAILLNLGTLYDNRASVSPAAVYNLSGADNLISTYREPVI